MKSFIYCVAIAVILSSCYGRANVTIKNRVHNVKLESVNFGNYPVASSVLPGETSSMATINDEDKNFPKIEKIQFYMTENGKTVFLETKAKYTLNNNQELIITISDTTAVSNPLSQ